VPSLKDMPAGCPFNNRCPYATEKCAGEFPAFESANEHHHVACWHWKEVK